MSTTAAPKSDSRTKFKSKLSFLHSTSTGASSSVSNKQANLPELLALLTTQQRADEDERRCAVVRKAIEPPVSRCYTKGELLTTPATTSRDKYEVRASSDSAKPSNRKECEESEVIENETSFTGEEEAILDEKAEPKAFTVSDVVVRKVREAHPENGPCQEDDLLDDLLGSSKAPLILEGTPTAFLHRGSAYRPLPEDLYSFVYYTGTSTTKTTNAAAYASSRTQLPMGHVCPVLTTADASTRCLFTARLGARVPILRTATLARPPWKARNKMSVARRTAGARYLHFSSSPTSPPGAAANVRCRGPRPRRGILPGVSQGTSQVKRRNRGARLTSLPETLRRSRAREVQQFRIQIDKLLQIAGNTSTESGRG